GNQVKRLRRAASAAKNDAPIIENASPKSLIDPHTFNFRQKHLCGSAANSTLLQNNSFVRYSVLRGRSSDKGADKGNQTTDYHRRRAQLQEYPDIAFNFVCFENDEEPEACKRSGNNEGPYQHGPMQPATVRHPLA